MEYFDVMDNGEYVQNGYVPAAYTAWEREALGWISIDTLKESQTLQMRSLDATENPGEAYRIMNPDDETGHEYLILQNLQGEGWNRVLCGRLGAHGLFVTHVDYNASAFSLNGNSVNNTIGHSRMTFIYADGDYVSGYEVTNAPKSEQAAKRSEYFAFHASAVFPGSSEVKELSTIPWYTGDSEVQQLAEISEDATGTVTLNYRNNSTPVTSVYMSAWPPRDIPCYDLGGRMQSTAGHGLFVQQGRKFFRR
jgi:immune inhibitor A